MNEVENIILQVKTLTDTDMSIEAALYRVLNKYEITKKENEIIVSNDDWKPEVDLYIARRVVSGLSEKSAKQYRYQLCTFFQAVGKRTKDVSEVDISNFLAYMKLNRKICDKSIRNIERCLSAYFGWETKKGYIPKNPMDGIDRTKVDKTVFYPFNRGMPVQEVQQILGHESIETTMIYCNVAAENVKYNHSKCA